MAVHTFYCPSWIDVGKGVLNTLPDIVKPYGKNVFVVMDAFFANHPLKDRITGLLPGCEVKFYTKVTPNPRTNDIDEGAGICRDFGAEVIVAIGGGSAIDTAKAINIVATNGGGAWDYARRAGETPREIVKPLLPLIAVPTTSGTGSEATRYSVITDHITHAKSTIKTDLNFPVRSLVDPELTVSVPRKTTALTGIDAFAHCFESYIGTKANPFSEMFSLQGIKLFIHSIERACENGNDMEAREEMAMCSTLGGLSITHSATTLPHGIGQALSGVTDAPHGGSIAVCMPEVIRWTLPYGQKKFAEVACMFDPSLKTLTEEEQAYALPDILDNLFTKIAGEKMTMTKYGMTEEKIPAVVDMAFHNYKGDLSRHPRVPTEEELTELIRKCL